MTPLPPNQQLVARDKWPVTGEKAPRREDRPWTLGIAGLVSRPRTFALAELQAMPHREFTVDIHCVTRWSKLGATFTGILLADIVALVEPQAEAKFVSFIARSERDHSTSLPLAHALELGAFLALQYAGEPLASEHGGPLRVVTPGRYFYKSLKWLERLEFLAEDRLGYWEAEAGYHNAADPWQEQRYLAANLSRNEVRQVLETRDFSDRDLRSIDASGRDLQGLAAGNARLRDADFRKCDLRNANFARANLSNARLQQADLRLANFAGADLEGANFAGCDLRSTDFRGASLFGASFVDLDGSTNLLAETGARLDNSTRFDDAQLQALTPTQLEFVRARWPQQTD